MVGGCVRNIMVEWVGTGRADQNPTSQHLLSTNPTCFEQRGIAQRKTPTPKMDTVLFPVEVRFESLVLSGAIESLR